MDMNQANFKKDMDFAEKCKPLWEEYVNGKQFLEKIQPLYKEEEIKIINIYYSEHPLVQKIAHLDAVISLNVGLCLYIDFKSLKPDIWWKNKDVYPVEVVSNPTEYGKTVGWGYHVGTTILHGMINNVNNPTKFIMGPILYTISYDFIDNITRNKKYKYHTNKPTCGLYQSGYRDVPRDILIQYFPNGRKHYSSDLDDTELDWDISQF